MWRARRHERERLGREDPLARFARNKSPAALKAINKRVRAHRRGRIEGLELRGTSQIIRSRVPLAQMFGYATAMRSLTQGRGSFTMHFARYEEAPVAVAEEVMNRMKGQ
mgnify:CR=1 FL=1